MVPLQFIHWGLFDILRENEIVIIDRVVFVSSSFEQTGGCIVLNCCGASHTKHTG